MTTDHSIDELLAGLEEAVESGLAYLGRPEAESRVPAGEWGIPELLAHMVFWHRSTVEGIESVLSGGDPYRLTGATDDLNAQAVEEMAGWGPARLIDEVRRLQARLVNAVRALPDPTVTVLVRAGGTESSGLDRLERIARHWREHLE